MTQTPDDVRAAYDTVAATYAERFTTELNKKPFDRAIVTEFAERVATAGGGPVLDLGCGPGQTTALLHTLGVDVTGVDYSPAMIDQAMRFTPSIRFRTGNMLMLSDADGSAAGIIAPYSIVNFTYDECAIAIGEMARVLRPGGLALISFHAGDGVVDLDEFLGHRVKILFRYFEPQRIAALLVAAGFDAPEIRVREPYPDIEYPSRRAYLLAKRR
jgi:ubiquinone/menaquinone biosynthesis C-methylase UbiE